MERERGKEWRGKEERNGEGKGKGMGRESGKKGGKGGKNGFCRDTAPPRLKKMVYQCVSDTNAGEMSALPPMHETVAVFGSCSLVT